MSGMALAAMVTMALPADATAQRGPRGDRGPGFAQRGQGVEMIMRLRDRLELSEEQLEELDQLRKESVERRTAHQAQMEELRSRVVAGEMTREELREIARARREGAEAVRTQQRERVEAILDDEQRQELETLRAQARGFVMGRASARRGDRGPAGRGFRGFRGDGGWRGEHGMRRGFRPQRGFGFPGGVRGPRGPGGQAPGPDVDSLPVGPGL